MGATVPKMLQAAQRIVSATHEPLILYVKVALCSSLPSVPFWQGWLEWRLNRSGGGPTRAGA